MKKITLVAAFTLLGVGVSQAQVKKDSVTVVVEGSEKKDSVKHKKAMTIHIGSNRVVGIHNKRKSWYIGFNPTFDFGWVRFNTNHILDADRQTVSDLALKKGPHFGLGLIKARLNITPNGVFKFNTGVGLDYSTYHFSKPLTLKPAQTRLIYSIDDGKSLRKNLLRSNYLTIPLMLSIHPEGKSDLKFLVGYEFGLLIGAKTKQIVDGDKIKQRDNFNLNPIRQGLVFRINYGAVGFFANYMLSDVFAQGQGPKGLQNFNFGVTLGQF